MWVKTRTPKPKITMAKAVAKSGKSKKIVKKRVVQITPEGCGHIHASFNNIIVSMTNKNGQVISWGSAGKGGFRGSKKNTPYAAQIAASDAAKVAFDAGMRFVSVVSVHSFSQDRHALARVVCKHTGNQ